MLILIPIHLLLDLNTLYSMDIQNAYHQQNLTTPFRVRLPIPKLSSASQIYRHVEPPFFCVTSFHITFCDHKNLITGHCCSLVQSINGPATLNVSQCSTTLTTREINWEQVRNGSYCLYLISSTLLQT